MLNRIKEKAAPVIVKQESLIGGIPYKIEVGRNNVREVLHNLLSGPKFLQRYRPYRARCSTYHQINHGHNF